MEKLILVLVDIRSLHNVGSIMRSADGMGVKTIISVGITPYMRQENDTRLPHVIERAEKVISKTALGAEKTIKNIHLDSVEEVTIMLKDDYDFVALEQADSSVSIEDFEANRPVALFVGNERDGLDQSLLKEMKTIVEIPMHGNKNSFNVAIAAAIAMYVLEND